MNYRRKIFHRFSPSVQSFETLLTLNLVLTYPEAKLETVLYHSRIEPPGTSTIKPYIAATWHALSHFNPSLISVEKLDPTLRVVSRKGLY